MAYYRVDGALVIDVVAPVGTHVRTVVNGYSAGMTAMEPLPKQ